MGRRQPEEVGADTAYINTLLHKCPYHLHVLLLLLTHDTQMSSNIVSRDNHARVGVICDKLIARGVVPWFDRDRMVYVQSVQRLWVYSHINCMQRWYSSPNDKWNRCVRDHDLLAHGGMLALLLKEICRNNGMIVIDDFDSLLLLDMTRIHIVSKLKWNRVDVYQTSQYDDWQQLQAWV